MGGLAAIGLRTPDLNRIVRFYTEALPGTVTRRREEPDRRAWIRVLDVPFEIAQVAAWSPLDEGQRRGLPAVSFATGPDELDALVAGLDAAGVPRRGPVLKMSGEAVGVYFSDPDGSPLSFSCPAGYPGQGLA